MSFDPGLAQRIREAVADEDGITERRMFGGLAFMRHGNMFVAVVGSALMARVGPARYQEALATRHVREMDFTGRPMTGYVFVDEQGIEQDSALQGWVDASIAFVRTVPRKRPK